MSKKLFFTIPVLVLLLTAVAATSVFAQVTPAGTQIRNRSSAVYQDMSGNNYTATSNEVITIVLPVYGVSILPDDSGETPPVTPAMTQNALPGMTLYYRYDLTNTGNDDDDFSVVPIVDLANTTMGIAAADVTVYRDLNSNGVVDLGEPVLSAGGAAGNTGTLTAGETISMIVSYTVPPTAASGQVAYVGVEGTSVGDPGQVDTRNYHLTTVVNDAVLTANLAAAPAIVFEGNQITYTLSGTNVGSNSANGVTVASVGLTGVLLYDVIPVNPATGNPLPIFGAPFGTPAGGTVLYLPAGNPTVGRSRDMELEPRPRRGRHRRRLHHERRDRPGPGLQLRLSGHGSRRHDRRDPRQHRGAGVCRQHGHDAGSHDRRFQQRDRDDRQRRRRC